MEPEIGDIRVRYYYQTCDKVTILAQQWNTLSGETTFRPFYFYNPKAHRAESTLPPSYYGLKVEFFQWARQIIGGPALDHADKAEPGTNKGLKDLILANLDQQSWNTLVRRLTWFFWLQLSLFSVCIPFVAEMAIIPIVGGSLLRLESQALVMLCFTFILGCAIHFIITGVIWMVYAPCRAVILILLAICCNLLIVFVGQPVPPDIAKYLLGTF